MPATHFKPGNTGDLYADTFLTDVADKGPCKVGKTGRNALKRLKENKAHICPKHATRVRKTWGFADQDWAETEVHALLAPYWMEPPADAESGKEWFNCSLAVVEAAIEKVKARELVYLKAMQRSLEYVGGVKLVPQFGAGAGPLDAVLQFRPEGKRTIIDCAYDALHEPRGSRKILNAFHAFGMRCLHVEKLVVFRTASKEFTEFLRCLGIPPGAKQLKNIVGFDHDGNPVSKKDLQTRCAGYDHAALLA